MRKPKPKNQNEWWVKDQIRQILVTTGWTYWMPNAGVFGRSGVSDFLAIKNPKLFMAIEAKYDDVVTALQFKFLTDIHEAGHYAFLVDETNIEELREVLTTNLFGVGVTFKSLMKWQTQNVNVAETEKPIISNEQWFTVNAAGTEKPISNEQWFALPLKLRERWWHETNYSSKPPSEELQAAIEEALQNLTAKPIK